MCIPFFYIKIIFLNYIKIDYITKRFEKEENKIRKDPAARVTDILMKVFGSITNK